MELGALCGGDHSRGAISIGFKNEKLLCFPNWWTFAYVTVTETV
jgi:hypothetical protein